MARDLEELPAQACPPGYRKVFWAQLREADQALWRYCQERCDDGTKAKPGEKRTEFENHWRTGMFDQDVRVHLQFLPATSASSGAASAAGPSSDPTAKLQKQMQNLQDELRGTKRRFQDMQTQRHGRGANNRGRPNDNRGNNNYNKGKGGRGSKGGKAGKGGGVPAEFQGMNTRDGDNRPICYSFNLAHGCSEHGASCTRGMHVCIKCGAKDHGLARCTAR